MEWVVDMAFWAALGGIASTVGSQFAYRTGSGLAAGAATKALGRAVAYGAAYEGYNTVKNRAKGKR